MMTKKLLRVTAMLLAAVMLFSLGGCSASGKVRPNARANKVVATAGDVEITYDNLYYVTMTRIQELKEVYGENVLESAEQRAELETFVKENLLTRSEALISIGYDYGLDVEKGDIADSVQAEIDTMLEETFANDRDAYIESLNAAFLTDRYVRTYLAVENYLSAAIINEMLIKGELDDSDDAAWQLINGDSFLHTIHVFIDRNNGKTDEENRANAAAVQARLAAKATDAERYAAMREEIGGKYNNDYGDLLGNGYYFTRGETETAYEEAAFALSNDKAYYGVSPVVEGSDGYYIMMLLPNDETYINEHFQELKEKTYYVKLNDEVDKRLASMTLEMTDYGNDLDLLDLPAIDADGGEVVFVVSIVIAAVLGTGAIVGLVYFLLKRKGKHKKKGKN